MSSSLSRLQIERPKAVRWQIASHVKDLIASGDLEPGAKLPTTQQLADRWGTHAAIVQAALTPLTKEGLLIRRPGVGTFVQDREQRLTHIGIYYSEDIWARNNSAFQQSLHRVLKQTLNQHEIETDVWIDPRPVEEQKSAWLPLVKAAETRKVQAIISPATDWDHIPWLRKLPVPSAFLSSANIPNRVSMDYRQMAEKGLDVLVKQGCRKVALICPLARVPTEPDGSTGDFFKFLRHFSRAAAVRQLQVREEWLRLLGDPNELRCRGQSQEHFGYEQFQALWRQTDRPDGLMLTPDTTARGALMALLQCGVRVPKELKLVIHRNEGVELLCPVPATFLITSEAKLAEALVKQVNKQFRGEVCRPILSAFDFGVQTTSGTTTNSKSEQ